MRSIRRKGEFSRGCIALMKCQRSKASSTILLRASYDPNHLLLATQIPFNAGSVFTNTHLDFRNVTASSSPRVERNPDSPAEPDFPPFYLDTVNQTQRRNFHAAVPQGLGPALQAQNRRPEVPPWIPGQGLPRIPGVATGGPALRCSRCRRPHGSGTVGAVLS